MDRTNIYPTVVCFSKNKNIENIILQKLSTMAQQLMTKTFLYKIKSKAKFNFSIKIGLESLKLQPKWHHYHCQLLLTFNLNFNINLNIGCSQLNTKKSQWVLHKHFIFYICRKIFYRELTWNIMHYIHANYLRDWEYSIYQLKWTLTVYESLSIHQSSAWEREKGREGIRLSKKETLLYDLSCISCHFIVPVILILYILLCKSISCYC